jgi:hypothetical protein
MTISLTKYINVNLSAVPVGIQTPNVNSLALFTTESPSNSDIYRIYLNSIDVGTDYGTNSETFQMAEAIFAQNPNILSGGGQLVIIPMIGDVDATSGYFATTNIGINLANIIAVSNGSVNVIVDGNTVALTKLNFTEAVTFTDVAKILQVNLANAIVTANGNTGITITSKKEGTGSTITLSANVTDTDLSTATLFNISAGSSVAGTNAGGETLISAIIRTQSQVQYVGVITDLEMEDDIIVSTATFIQSQDMIFLHHLVSKEDINGIGATIQASGDFQTKFLLYTASPSLANLAKSAYSGRAFSTDMTGTSTAITMNFKQLATILPDGGINNTDFTNCQTEGIDFYASVTGVGGCVTSNAVAGYYFDVVYFRIAFKLALQTALFNYLAQTNTKIPQTELGMTGLKNAIRNICDQFVTNGYIAPGKWNSSQTFGNQQDFIRNIADKGYYIYSLPVANQSQSDRNNRIAPLIQLAVKMAGAIHFVNINGFIEN